MAPVLVVARLTVQEASRRRLLLALVILTLIVVGFSAWGFHKITELAQAGEAQLISSQLLIVVTFMFSGVLALSAAVVAGPLISSEVESGLLLAVLARPVRRSEIVIGKWLGLAVLVAIYAGAAGLLEMLAVDWATGYVPPHPIQLIVYVAVEGLALLSLGLVLSTRLSGITGGVIALVAWLMGWIGSGRWLWGRPPERGCREHRHHQQADPALRRAVAWRCFRDGAGRGARAAQARRHARPRQPVCGGRSSTDRIPGLGRGVVCDHAGAEHLELPDPRDLKHND